MLESPWAHTVSLPGLCQDLHGFPMLTPGTCPPMHPSVEAEGPGVSMPAMGILGSWAVSRAVTGEAREAGPGWPCLYFLSPDTSQVFSLFFFFLA